MPYCRRRVCPICGKQDLLKLSEHLRQVHQLSSHERQPWLKAAVFTPTVPYRTLYPFSTPQTHGPPHPYGLNTITCLEPQPYPEFTFQHPFSMMVVGPSQCGKTHFVQQLLTSPRIAFPDKKPVKVYWFYNQWQPIYEDIRRVLKKNIRFAQGVPDLNEDLSNIHPALNNMIVLDDLMAEAKDSPVVSKLFTQGRHRNASVILLLQNMFPKGKFNTDISRNALYKVLFRSPGDRKQIDIMAEQTFAKDRPHFMKAYTQETENPYGYILLDNHPRTTSDRQVVADVFGQCNSYPCISTLSSTTGIPLEDDPPQVTKRRIDMETRYEPAVKKRKRPAVKRKPVKKQSTRTCKAVQSTKQKKPLQPSFAKRDVPVDEPSEEDYSDGPLDSNDHEWFTSHEDELSDYSDRDPSEEERTDNNSEGTWYYPKKGHRFIQPPPRTGFGPRCIY